MGDFGLPILVRSYVMANYQRVSRKQMETIKKDNKKLVERVNHLETEATDYKRTIERIKNESTPSHDTAAEAQALKNFEELELKYKEAQEENHQYSHQVGTLSKEKEDLEKKVKDQDSLIENLTKELQGLKMKPNKGGNNGSKSGNKA